MPLVFWAAQTMAAANLLGVGEYGSTLTSYISLSSAATVIQNAYCTYIRDKSCLK
jgi:hypothetical protein